MTQPKPKEPQPGKVVNFTRRVQSGVRYGKDMTAGPARVIGPTLGPGTPKFPEQEI